MAVDFLDRFSRGTSCCHRWPARLKIALTFAVILAVVLVPISLWPVHGCLACLVFAAHALADIPLSYLARRIALLLPAASLMALTIPVSRGLAAGWDLAATVVVRALLSFLGLLWLVNTTPFETLLAAFRGLGLPRSFVALLAFTYRYLFVVFDELARMRTAQRARTFGRRSPWRVWNSTVQLVAVLLIRSLNRSERVHQAMLARGWQGEIRTID